MKTYLCRFLHSLTYCISSKRGFLDLSATFKMAHFLLTQSKLSASGRSTFTLGALLMQESMQYTATVCSKNKPVSYEDAL